MIKEKDGTQVLAVRVPDGIMRKMQGEIDEYREHRTKSEFALDAIKWYLKFRVDERIEVARAKGDTDASNHVGEKQIS